MKVSCLKSNRKQPESNNRKKKVNRYICKVGVILTMYQDQAMLPGGESFKSCLKIPTVRRRLQVGAATREAFLNPLLEERMADPRR